jgi:hypothetical protein
MCAPVSAPPIATNLPVRVSMNISFGNTLMRSVRPGIGGEEGARRRQARSAQFLPWPV